MRDGQQKQSIRYEVKLRLRQTAYCDSEDTETLCDCFFFSLIEHWLLFIQCSMYHSWNENSSSGFKKGFVKKLKTAALAIILLSHA